MAIRSERVGDAPRISELVRRAYADVRHSDHREHLMVDRLRQTDAYVPALSLLAEVDGELVGHILLTKARIVDGASTVATLALAPLSVAPAFQRRGIGGSLVGVAHRQAKALGFASVAVVGAPAYYARFGYEPSSRYRITLPVAAADEYRMILPLLPGALDGVRGRVAYAPGWLEH